MLVDDHAIVLDGLEALIKAGFNCCITKASVASFAVSHLKKESFDLMITDYSMPDMDGLLLVKKAREISPQTPVIMLSMHEDAHTIREVMAAGVSGYVLKKYAQQELMHAINSVLGGRQYWSQEVSKALLKNPRPDEDITRLTERETEVLKLLVKELNSREIAEQLFISERTVETHRKNLMRKTNSVNAVGLVKYAYANKLV